MLNSSLLRRCAPLATAIVLFCATASHAGLFDWFKSKPKAQPGRSATAAPRGQSPAYDAPASSWQPSPAAAPWSGGGYQPGSNYGYPAGSMCCGPELKYVSSTVRCREKCDQTYYTPVPPYCFACYGVHPTCWRRMAECSVCPRQETPAPPPKAPRPSRVAPPSVPAAPPAADDPPEPVDDPAMSRRRALPQRSATVSSNSGARSTTRGSRWTGFADAVPEEDEIPEAPADTLEAQIEADEEATDAALDENDDLESPPIRR